MTLTELRKAQGLTQQQVADALGIKYQYVQLWERGERRPGTMYLTKLAKLYKVPIEMLLKFKRCQLRKGVKKVDKVIKEAGLSKAEFVRRAAKRLKEKEGK